VTITDAPAPPGTLGDRVMPLDRALRAIDEAGDRWSNSLRGRRVADVGAVVLSNLSDYGIAWVATAVWKGRRPGPGRRRALVALAVSGVASYAVNRAVKRLVRRSRPPTPAASHGALWVRAPASTSFPSGHTLAAFCTALVLPDTRWGRRAALVIASAVAASRVHVRAHHASDVLGGAVIGAALGTLARPITDLVARK
jgi:membrane-associated phospholipid phosphatase